MKNGSILIISNNQDIGKQISEKIKLLRECDKIKCVSFLEAISVLNSCQPGIIILYWSKTDSVNIVREIRGIKALDKVPIIFVMDNLIEEILFCAFDYGIDEFFCLNEPDSVILMRIFLSLQKSILYKKIDTNDEILTAANIIDKKTGIYTSDYSSIVMKHFFNKSLEENLEDTIFMYVRLLPLDKKYLNITKVGSLIKSVPRSNDIIAYSENTGVYILLYNCGLIGAKSVTQRLQKALNGICEVYINAAEVTAPYDEIQPVLQRGINEQIIAKNEFNYFYESDIKDANEYMKTDKAPKKIITKEKKQEIFNKFEKTVVPIFYHFQTVYNNTFDNVDIKFDISEEKSFFSFSKGNTESKITITLPEYIKVSLEVSHCSEGSLPSVKKLSYNIQEFNEELLTSILKNLVNEFSERISHTTLSQTE